MVTRGARALLGRLPGAASLHVRWTAARVRRRRERQWERAHTCVVSFPKSGRTWLHVMLARLAHGAQRPFVLDVPGVLFTHDDADKPALPLRTDFDRYAGRKVVLLVRDPRDVLVSYFAHRTRRDHTYEGTLAAFVREPGYGAERIATFMAGWWRHRTVPRGFLLVRYEDLHADPRKELERLARFLGLPHGDAELEEAVAFAAFDRMVEMERAGAFADKRLRAADAGDPESYKVRRGEVGGWATELTAVDAAWVSTVMARTLPAELGYRAP
jgi:sulfotransferase family protein